jgi:hypothetical protein
VPGIAEDRRTYHLDESLFVRLNGASNMYVTRRSSGRLAAESLVERVGR